MSLSGELARFETLLAERFPTVLARMSAGLDDAGIAKLQEALLPMRLTEEIETIYRWRDGGDAGLFGGWALLSAQRVIDNREFCLGVMHHPPAWLSLFDPGEGCFGVVSLDVPGSGTVPGVWFGMTHDVDLNRLFVSIESLVATCGDAIEGGLLSVFHEDHPLPISLQISEDDVLDGLGFIPLRTAREAITFVYPDPPEGTNFISLAEPSWPKPWLDSLGLDSTPPALRGATHSIAELLAASERGAASGIIQARIVRFGASADWWMATLDDGTGQLAVTGTDSGIFGPSMGQNAEFDIEIDSSQSREIPDDRRPDGSERPRMFPGESASAVGFRPIPD